MRWILDANVKARVAVLVIAAAVAFFGFRDIRSAPVDVLPEFGPTTVQIQTEALGLSAEEVEQLITVPMEQDLLNGVAWLESIHSQSIPGLSSIDLVFEPGTDPYHARLAVQERVSQAKVALPGVSSPPQMLQPVSATNRVMIVGVSSTELSPIEMSVLARWTIRPRLMGVPGVANVSIWGQRERQLQVLVDPRQLRDRGVALRQIVETTANALWVSPLTFVEASTPGTSGFIDTPNQRLSIQHILPISSPADLEQVNVEDSTLQLGDVSTVVEDHQPLIGDAVASDGSTLLFVIEKFPEANTLDTTRNVEDAIDNLRPGLAGLQFDTSVFRPATSTEHGLNRLEVVAVIGLALAVLAVGLVFLQWRTAVVMLVVFPLSLLAAGIVLHLRGETVNVVVIAGLVAAVAIVIDDVVRDTHAIMQRLRQRAAESGDDAIAAIIVEASMETRSVATFAGLIAVAAALPVFFLDGLAGDFFPPLALSYLIAMAMSMVVALVVTPALAAILVSVAPPRGDESSVGRWLVRHYGALLERCFRAPRPLLLLPVVLLIVAGIVIVPTLHRPSLVPSFKEDQLLIHLEGPPGTSLPEMDRITGSMAEELRAVPGVRDVGGHVGRAIMSDQVVGTNSSELWVTLGDGGGSYGSTVAAIRQIVSGYPGLVGRVVSYSDELAGGQDAAPSRDLSVRIYGEDLGVLRTKAREIRDVVSGIDGVADAKVDAPTEEAGVEIAVDLTAAQRYGIEPGAVRRAAATLLQGIDVGSLFEHQKVFQVIVRGTPQTRESLTSIRDLSLETPSGGNIRLADVADVRIAPNQSVIERDSVSRRVDVLINVSGRSRGAVLHDVEESLRKIEFPLEYNATVLAPADENPWDRLAIYGLFAAVAIFLLLQAAFSSWRWAALTFLALPTALVGGLYGARIGGGDITIGSYAGLLTLLVIGVRGAISLVRRYQILQQAETEADALMPVRGAQEQVVPVLTTVLATAVGLAALLFVGDIFGYEVLKPMLLVVLSGLVTSTLFVLFVLPVLSLVLAPGPVTEDRQSSPVGVSPAHSGQSAGGS